MEFGLDPNILTLFFKQFPNFKGKNGLKAEVQIMVFVMILDEIS